MKLNEVTQNILKLIEFFLRSYETKQRLSNETLSNETGYNKLIQIVVELITIVLHRFDYNNIV